MKRYACLASQEQQKCTVSIVGALEKCPFHKEGLAGGGKGGEESN